MAFFFGDPLLDVGKVSAVDTSLSVFPLRALTALTGFTGSGAVDFDMTMLFSFSICASAAVTSIDCVRFVGRPGSLEERAATIFLRVVDDAFLLIIITALASSVSSPGDPSSG